MHAIEPALTHFEEATLSMSTAILAPSLVELAVPRTSRLTVWVLIGLVALVFLMTEHNWTVSAAEAYTSTEDQMEASAGGGNIVRRLAFLTLAGVGVVALATSSRKMTLTPGGCLLAFYVAWCAASVLWSIDPAMTVRRLFVFGCYVLGAVGLAGALSGRDLLRMAMTVALVGLAVGVVAELSLGTFQPFGAEYRFAGTQHPNTTALSLAAISIGSFCLWRSERKKLAPTLLFCIGFGFLILTKSRTSAAGLLAALLFLWTLSTPLRIKLSVVLTGMWAFGVAALVILLGGFSVEDDLTQMALMGRGEQSESLTGRIPIWTELAPWVGRRFLFGYGFDSFWVPDHIDRVSRELQWAIREAHSAYVDLTLSVGVVAGLALVTALILGMRRSARLYLADRRPEHGFFLGLQLYGLINALTESAMSMPLFIPFVAATGAAQLLLFEERHP